MRPAQERVEHFRALYEEMSPVVFGYARARLGHTEAEDVTADVFHAAASQAKAGDIGVVTAAWLMTVTRNKVIDHWRRSERHSRVIAQVRSHEITITLDQSEHDHVMDALDDIRPDYRAVLILKYLEGCSVTKIAETLEVSQAAAESRLARARRALRNRLLEHTTLTNDRSEGLT